MIGGRLSSLRTISSRVIAKTKPLSYLKHIHLYQYVLPWVTKSNQVEFLRQKGPRFWKSLDIKSDRKHIEPIQLMILTEHGLSMQLPAYFHLWDTDTINLPVHIYEMGWGHHLQQCSKSYQLLYLQSLNPTEQGREPLVVLPVLSHTDHYFSANLDYLPEVHADNKGPSFSDVDNVKELCYVKLFCAEACSKRERWSECFSHALSALDHIDTTFPHRHNVYCQLALSAGKMSQNPDVWISLLRSARQIDQYSHHKWKRTVTFHSLLVHHGMFDLERIVFNEMAEQIPSNSSFHTQLLIQHLYALMAQVENIAAFQFVRQVFHQDCNAKTCGKPLFMDYSFAQADILIREMEKVLQYLPNETQRHYFHGYTYLYKSFGSVLNVPTEKDKTYLELAKASFELATLECDSTALTAMEKDLVFVRANLKNLDIDALTIQQSFSALTNSRYNMETANTCFRVVLLFYYWGNECVKSPPIHFADAAHKTCAKTTAYNGYRMALISACQSQLNFGLLEHTDEETDYPPIGCMSVPNVDLKEKLENYWKLETGQMQTNILDYWTTSQQVLSNYQDCQELFAFGAQIITTLIQ